MPALSEEHRTKLDTIVSRMVSNGEPRENIQTVVNDFKAKYGTVEPAQPKDAGFLSTLGKDIAALPGAIYNVSQHPVEFLENTLDRHAEQFRKAGESFQAGRKSGYWGDYSQAAGHALAGALPFIGPAAAEAGEEIGEGRYGEGAAHAVELLAPMAVRPALSGVNSARAAVAARMAELPEAQLGKVLPVAKAVGRNLPGVKRVLNTIEDIKKVLNTGEGAGTKVKPPQPHETLEFSMEGAPQPGTAPLPPGQISPITAEELMQAERARAAGISPVDPSQWKPLAPRPKPVMITPEPLPEIPPRQPVWSGMGSPTQAEIPQLQPITGALPSGRVPGPAPIPPETPITPRTKPAWASLPDVKPAALPDSTPITGNLPSGRVPGGIQNQTTVVPPAPGNAVADVPVQSAVTPIKPVVTEIPKAYQGMGSSLGKMAYEKDSIIAKYLKAQKYSPEDWMAMTLDEQNALIAKAGKEAKRVFKPFSKSPQGLGRDAAQGVSHIHSLLSELYGR